MVHRHQRFTRAAAAILEVHVTALTRLRVDPIACDGRGLCAEIAPELVTLDDWGFPIVAGDAVPPGWMVHARKAVRLCPKLALRLE